MERVDFTNGEWVELPGKWVASVDWAGGGSVARVGFDTEVEAIVAARELQADYQGKAAGYTGASNIDVYQIGEKHDTGEVGHG